MILGVGLARKLKPGSLLLVDGGRVLVYMSLSLGLVVGKFAVSELSGLDASLMLYSLCGVSIVMLVATVLTPFRDQEQPQAVLAVATAGGEAASADNCGALSEVVEDAKQNTPMSASSASASPSSDAEAKEGSTPDVTSDDAGDSTGVINGEPSAPEQPAATFACAGPGKPSATTPGVPAAASAPHRKESSSQRSSAAKSGDAAKRSETPWRRTCRSMAELYKLSPRETEIFFLIAKGRNAEYVQKTLIISLHTAKTHIANIYHKLGVHSSQEMLSLIETFREQDSKSHEKSGD